MHDLCRTRQFRWPVLLTALEARESVGPSRRWAILCGAAIGYAANVSPFVAVPMVAVTLHRLVVNRRRIPLSARECAWFALPIFAGLLLFGGVNLATTGSLLTPAYYLRPSVRAGFGSAIGAGGYTPAKAVALTLLRLRSLNQHLFGWPGSSLLFAAPYAAVVLVKMLPGRTGARPRGEEVDSVIRLRLTRAFLLFASTVVVYAFWYSSGTFRTRGLGTSQASCVGVFSARGVVGSPLPVSAGGCVRGRSVGSPGDVSGGAPFDVPRWRRSRAGRSRRAERWSSEDLERRDP